MKSETLLSTGEVARRLGVPPYKLHYLIATGRIAEPLLRVAGKRVWNETEVEAAQAVMQERLRGEEEVGR